MIPDQFPKKTTTLEVGKTYFRVNSCGSGELFTPASKVAANAWPESTYYGPINTTPSLIDLSHFDLSKIEPKKQPDKPGLWHAVVPGEKPFVCQYEDEEFNERFYDGEYRFLCNVVLPKQSVIPPKPENVLHLMRLKNIISPLDGSIGDIRWCTKRSDGHYRTLLESGAESGVWWANCQCEPVTE